MHTNIKLTFLIFSFCISFNLYGQEREVKKLTPDKRHKVGETMVEKGSYYNAVDQMEDLIREHPNNKKYQFNLADAYFFSRDYKNAEIWFKKLADAEGDKIVSPALFRYAECLKYNGKYKEARDAFQKFAKSRYRDKRGAMYKSISKNEVESCTYALENEDDIQPIEIMHLGDNVNSKYSEFSPFLWNDSTLIFASLQSDTVLTVSPDDAHTHQVKLYSSALNGGEWGTLSALPTINSTFENNANGSFSPDRKSFYFTRCIIDKEDNIICNIYVSPVVGNKFGKPKKLPAKINRKGYSATQPHITTGLVGKTKMDILYFASNRPGGRGGFDLWYSTIDKNGNYRSAANLGRDINTLRDEITPYIDTTTGTLYFSSNFHYGFGGYDVFKAKGNLNRWEKPENIKKPVNSRVDDTYFTIKGKKIEGFVVSNRPEGYHLTSETCCDDIYSYAITKELLLAKLSAYDNKKDRHELSAVQLKLFERSQNDISRLLNTADSGDTIAMIVSNLPDSLKPSRNSKLLGYARRGNSKFSPAKTNSIIPGGKYEELTSADNSYLLDPSKEYMAAAVSDKDTIYFLFHPDKKNYISSSYAPDTSLAEYQGRENEDFKLVRINLFFNKLFDSTAFVKEAKVDSTETSSEVESEKSNTVAKAMRDIAAQNTKDLKIILNYDFDDTKFIEKHSGSLDSLVTLLKKYPAFTIFIAAHTDSKGSDDYNNNLSKRRARSIMDYMSKQGISKKRMKSKGFGETIPLVPNENPDGTDSPENRWLNRRAEITILSEEE